MLLLNNFLTIPASLSMEGIAAESGIGKSWSPPKAFLLQAVLPRFRYNSVCFKHGAFEPPVRKHDGRKEVPVRHNCLNYMQHSRPKRSMFVFISIFHSSDNSLGGPPSPRLNLEGYRDLREDLKEDCFFQSPASHSYFHPTKPLTYIWKWV